MPVVALLLANYRAVKAEHPNGICEPKAIKNSLVLAEAQVDWILSMGGSFDTSKIVIQSVETQEGSENCSTNHNLGLFAINDIQKGDALIKVPGSAIFTGDSDKNRCDGTLTLLQEIAKGREESDFGPYLDYLYSKQGISFLPSMWSSAGRDLLKTIHGPNLKPKDIVDVSFLSHCTGERDEFEIEIEEETRKQVEFAYATMLARSWDEKLVPLVDMINHSRDFNTVTKVTSLGETEDPDTLAETEDPDTVEVHADRDILKGEQLYLSYRRRDDDSKLHTAKTLRNFGFVEQYPQRWVLPTPSRRSNIEENQVPDEIMFDIVRKGDEDEYQVKWIDPANPPRFYFVVEHLKKELDRITDIKPLITQTAGTLHEHERSIIVRYYRSLTIAYENVIASIQEALDTLPAPVENPGDKFMACDDFEAIYARTDGWEFADGFFSSHQGVDFYYNEKKKDVCLFLEEYLHACLSNRPHYHEVFVHYPAQFLEKVQRVLFIGGGDSMVLHEVLKYDQLELVVGLELDQLVVRSTFAHMGTQPHFHNDKVQWWFGDAAVALNALPTEYYGTFDLVIVDILSEVAEMLQVTENVTIMEAAMMLMKPDGIIVKNEDEGYVPGSTKSVAFPPNTADVVYYDVPVYCLQTFVMGSNSFDFLERKPLDHNVSKFYLKDVDEFQAQFDTWYSSGTTSEGAENEAESHGNDSNENSTPFPSIIGVATIIEAEDITIPLKSSSNIQEIINKKVVDVGFTVINSSIEELSGGYSILSLLEEGCITARCFISEKYCALDVQLWKSVHKAELTKAELLSSLGSDDSSVFRVITTGIYGVEENNNNPMIGPPHKTTLHRQHSSTREDETDLPKTETTLRKRKDPTVNFKNATTDDFDPTSALSQWESQEPFGFQCITKFGLPFEYAKEKVSKMLCEVVKEALIESSEEWEDEDEDQIVVTPHGVGDGLVVIAAWSEGTLVFVWDGLIRVDMNFFSLEESATDTLLSVEEHFRAYLKDIAKDEFPRGTGRVINTREVLVLDEEEDTERPQPFWAP